MIGGLIRDIGRGVETVATTLAEPFSEPAVRLGVTGLSQAGKTVFITALVANLMDRGRMPLLRGAAGGAIQAAWLQPQPDLALPRFDFESHLAALTGPEPRWPQGTRAVSELRLSFRVQTSGLMGAVSGPRTVHLDILDYPGEWLLDLTLLGKDYAAWSAATLARMETRPEARAYLAQAAAADPRAPHDEGCARSLAQGFTGWLRAARAAGWSDCTPGRFLLPGDLEGAPVVTFAPLPGVERPPRGSLGAEMARRHDGYLREVVRPFFRDHFARIDRQVVLVDALAAIHAGPAAVEDMRRTLVEILGAFRPGRASFLARLIGAPRVERILFAANKADHLHHSQHDRLSAIMQAMLREARDRADFAGARTAAMAIASLRSTVEDSLRHQGRVIDCVRGRRADTGRDVAFHAGDLPEDPAQILAPARTGAPRWLDGDYGTMAFAPARLSLRPGEGPPHIRLDRAAEFLIGDWLA